jgi:hypothetical protein
MLSGVTIGALLTPELGLLEDDGLSDDDGAGVDEGCDPPEVAMPVMEASIGACGASVAPTTAYTCPFRRLKKGRGTGDSLQQSTCCASALQHHWSSWSSLSSHCVMDSPPTACRSIAE